MKKGVSYFYGTSSERIGMGRSLMRKGFCLLTRWIPPSDGCRMSFCYSDAVQLSLNTSPWLFNSVLVDGL